MGFLAWTHSFVQKERVSCQRVGAQQASQDADGAFKQVHVHILVEGELRGHPCFCFFKLCNNICKNKCFKFSWFSALNSAQSDAFCFLFVFIIINKHRVQSTFFKAENPHRIQGINERQTQAKPLAVGLGERPELIMAPSKVFVTLPCMSEGFPHRLQPDSIFNTAHTKCPFSFPSKTRAIQKHRTGT